MAKISGLTLLGATPADNDEFVILDVSDTTQGADGSTKALAASRVARTGAANTFTATQTIDANQNDLLTLKSTSSGFCRLNLNSDLMSLLDLNDYGGVLKARIQYLASDNAFVLSNRTSAGTLRFQTTTGAGTTTEAMRIDDGQRLLIGYTTSNGAFRLQVNSQIYATNATVATSDERVKTNVEDLAEGLAAVLALRPVVFDFVEHEIHEFSRERQIGFIAQEVEYALGETDYVESIVPPTENEEQLKGIAADKIVALLVKAVQEQQAMIEAQATQIEELTARVEALEGGQ